MLFKTGGSDWSKRERGKLEYHAKLLILEKFSGDDMKIARGTKEEVTA